MKAVAFQVSATFRYLRSERGDCHFIFEQDTGAKPIILVSALESHDCREILAMASRTLVVTINDCQTTPYHTTAGYTAHLDFCIHSAICRMARFTPHLKGLKVISSHSHIICSSKPLVISHSSRKAYRHEKSKRHGA